LDYSLGYATVNVYSLDTKNPLDKDYSLLQKTSPFMANS
jgi:hypothetical protein